MSHSLGGAGGETLRPGLHVLVVTQYFWPKKLRINDLVASLTERGHEVVGRRRSPHRGLGSGNFAQGGGSAAVERMADMPAAEFEPMGRNGKAYFDMNFARDRVLDRLDSWLAEVTDKTAAPARTK